MPTVSVVTPTYNRADQIGQAIESVLAQTYDDWEHIIVDDASTDDTQAVRDAIDAVGPGGTVNVDVTVANVGDRAGTTSVELFVQDLLSSRVTPVQELCGIDRVQLAPGERGHAQFAVAAENLGIVHEDDSHVTEPGTFELTVGDLSAEFEVSSRYQ